MEQRKSFVNSLTFQMDITSRRFWKLVQDCFNLEVKNRITLDEYLVLDTIVCYPYIDKDILAKTLAREKAFIERIIAKLLKKKLISIVTGADKSVQIKYFELTKEGSRRYYEIIPMSDVMVEILAKFISEAELVSFTKTLLKIRNILISLSDVNYMR